MAEKALKYISVEDYIRKAEGGLEAMNRLANRASIATKKHLFDNNVKIGPNKSMPPKNLTLAAGTGFGARPRKIMTKGLNLPD